ncbi:hypothetical protein D3C79_935220 [compost metagenome]
MTPSTGTLSCTRAIRVAKSPLPAMNSPVPSRGSTSQYWRQLARWLKGTSAASSVSTGIWGVSADSACLR